MIHNKKTETKYLIQYFSENEWRDYHQTYLTREEARNEKNIFKKYLKKNKFLENKMRIIQHTITTSYKVIS